MIWWLFYWHGNIFQKKLFFWSSGRGSTTRFWRNSHKYWSQTRNSAIENCSTLLGTCWALLDHVVLLQKRYGSTYCIIKNNAQQDPTTFCMFWQVFCFVSTMLKQCFNNVSTCWNNVSTNIATTKPCWTMLYSSENDKDRLIVL